MLDLTTLHGIFPPLSTPLTPAGDIDRHSLKALCGFVLESGVHGLWANGTTGEFACFDADERQAIVSTCVEAAAGRVPVVANVGDCSTRLALGHAHRAAAAGADVLALTPPYYYLNSQDELLAHFRAVRAAVDLPLLVYNIPQTVKARFDVPTILTLAGEGTIVGMKDSQNDLDWDRNLLVGLDQRGLEFRLFLGTRTLLDAGILVGAHGAITGVANVVPAWYVAAYEAAVQGDFKTARRWQERIIATGPLTTVAGGSAHAASFAGFKLALKAMGIIAHATLAAPLRSPTDDEEQRMAELVHQLELPIPVAA